MSLFLAFVLKHWRWFALAVFLAAVAGASYYRGRHDGQAEGRRAVTASEVAKAKEQTKAAEELAKATQDQAERYRTKAEAQEAIAAQYLQELNNANDRADRTVADIRSGYIRMRDQWRCPKVPASGQASADPGESEGDPGLQAASVGRIDRAVSACQAHVKALLEVAECDRGLRVDCKG